MDNEQSPAGSPRSNKGVVVLLVGGVLILAAAGVVYFARGSAAPEPEPEPPVVEEVIAPAAPLVAVRESKPIAARDQDAGSAVETEQNTPPPAKSKGGGGGGGEKMGKIDAKAVNKFINSNFGQVKACYERRLRTNSLLEGKVDLNIGVNTRGRVTSVVVNRDTVRDAEMLGCVKRVVRGWKFPKPEGGRVVIGKTFNFKKKG
jgi:hypothetical protein